MSETSLHSAIRNEKLTSKQGFLQKLFAVWFDAFVYNQIWEDPRVDIEALQIDSDSRILTISSGGCNALNYLIEGPRSVTAVDRSTPIAAVPIMCTVSTSQPPAGMRWSSRRRASSGEHRSAAPWNGSMIRFAPAANSSSESSDTPL